MKIKIREPIIDQERNALQELIMQMEMIIMGLPGAAVGPNLEQLLSDAIKNHIVAEAYLSASKGNIDSNATWIYDITIITLDKRKLQFTKECYT